jgi:hypothetical protein
VASCTWRATFLRRPLLRSLSMKSWSLLAIGCLLVASH